MIKIGLEELQAKIREDGEDEIKKINAAAKKETDEIKKNIRRKADVQVNEILKEGKQEVELVRRRIIAEANVAVKEQMELERNQLLDKAFEEAKNRILELSDDQKKEILESLVAEGREGIKDPVVLVDKKYKNLINDAKSSDLNDFGVVVISGDETLRVDNTLNSRLHRLKVTLKPRVASALFSGDEAGVSDTQK